jgi:hypothetical protein
VCGRFQGTVLQLSQSTTSLCWYTFRVQSFSGQSCMVSRFVYDWLVSESRSCGGKLALCWARVWNIMCACEPSRNVTVLRSLFREWIVQGKKALKLMLPSVTADGQQWQEKNPMVNAGQWDRPSMADTDTVPDQIYYSRSRGPIAPVSCMLSGLLPFLKPVSPMWNRACVLLLSWRTAINCRIMHGKINVRPCLFQLPVSGTNVWSEATFCV